MAFCKVSSLAWRALLQVAPPKSVRNFHFDQEKQAGFGRPGWVPAVSSEGDAGEGSPCEPCASPGFLPFPLCAEGVGLSS